MHPFIQREIELSTSPMPSEGGEVRSAPNTARRLTPDGVGAEQENQHSCKAPSSHETDRPPLRTLPQGRAQPAQRLRPKLPGSLNLTRKLSAPVRKATTGAESAGHTTSEASLPGAGKGPGGTLQLPHGSASLHVRGGAALQRQQDSMSRGELELAVRPPLSSYSIATQRRPARGGFSGDTASSGSAADSSSGVMGLRMHPLMTAQDYSVSAAGYAAAKKSRKSSIWPETDISIRKSFSFAHKGLWLEKQEKAFQIWLNALLTPQAAPDDDGGLLARRLYARVRGRIWQMYCSDPGVIGVMTLLEKRVDEGFLRMKAEASKMGDVRLKQHISEVLAAYHPFWLRLGLEIIAGKAVPPADGSTSRLHSSRAELEAFAREHFLNDADLAQQRAGNRALGTLHGDVYWLELGQLVLKRFLLLVLLLDKAKAAGPEQAPLLFRRGQPLKSSAEAALRFLRERMHGEGDTMRHLASMGYRLSYEQDPRTEFDFAVRNMSVDLRSGVRLLRAAELLTGKPGLVQEGFFPASKRGLQVHNLQRALAALETSQGYLAGLPARMVDELVDGHREATLDFLWNLLLHHQLPALVNARALHAEVDRITKAGQSRPLGLWLASLPRAKSGSDAAAQLMESLLKWTQVICAKSGLVIRGWASSFADGQAICLLISYYLPRLLSCARISRSAPTPDEDEGEGVYAFNALDASQAAARRKVAASNFALISSAAASLGGIPSMLTAEDCCAPGGPHEHAVIGYIGFLCARLLEVSAEERALHTIQKHWRLSRARRAGGARKHLHTWIAAASKLQRAWRVHTYRQGLQRAPALRRAMLHAVTRLQALWRGRPARLAFLMQRMAAVKLQACIRGWRDRRWVMHNITVPRILRQCIEAKQALEHTRQEAYYGRVATKLQARRRGLVQARQYGRVRCSAVSIQAAWRCAAARRAFRRHRAAAVCIQAHWRGLTALRAYQAAKRATAAVVVQATWRGFKARAELTRQHLAATFTQAWWKGRRQSAAFQQLRSAVVLIQARQRMLVARKRFLRTQGAAVLIQRHMRGCLVRRHMAEQRLAATCIQAAVRMRMKRSLYRKQREAAVLLQSAVRCMQQRNRFLQLKRAAVCIQRLQRGHSVRMAIAQHAAAVTVVQKCWRGCKQKRTYLRMQAAAVRLQSAVRCWQLRGRFLQARSAAVTVQAYCRGWHQRRRLVTLRAAATVIQKHWRAARLQQTFKAQLACIVLVQSCVRRYLAVKQLQQAQSAATSLQACWRGRAARQAVARQRGAAVAIQSAWRQRQAMRRYARDVRDITSAQALVRGWLARQSLSRCRGACNAIQAHWRGHVARRRVARIRAAVVIQKHVRGHECRRALAAQRKAATQIQAGWRMHVAQRRFQKARHCIVRAQALRRGCVAQRRFQAQRNAATILQTLWMGRTARCLARQHRAARLIQSQWRGLLVRRAAAMQLEAAVVIQKCWRQARALAAYQKSRNCIILVQACARMQAGRRQLQRAQHATTLIQAHWRRRCAIRLRQQTAAAICIQRWVRGWQQRQRLDRMRLAATLIQSIIRMHVQRKRYRSMVVMQQAVRRMVKTAQKFARRTAAAVKMQVPKQALMQALARGYLARCEFRRRVAERKAAEDAALAVIRPWARTAVARLHFLRLRRMTKLIQCWYRRRFARRVAAITRLQAALRMRYASRGFQSMRSSALVIQSHWRGARQRRTAGKPAAVMTRRLRTVLAMQTDPAKTLAARTASAMQHLQHGLQLTQAMAPVAELAHCVHLSGACAVHFVRNGAPSVLIHFMRSCNRSAPHLSMFRNGLCALACAVKQCQLAQAVFAARDDDTSCPALLAAAMLQHRDSEDIFMEAADLLERSAAFLEPANGVSAKQGIVRQLEPAGQLLVRKVDVEAKYLNRLEGQKGSDTSAREATRKLVAARKQLLKLHQVLLAFGSVPARELQLAADSAADGLKQAPRNMIVRNTLRTLR